MILLAGNPGAVFNTGAFSMEWVNAKEIGLTRVISLKEGCAPIFIASKILAL